MVTCVRHMKLWLHKMKSKQKQAAFFTRTAGSINVKSVNPSTLKELKTASKPLQCAWMSHVELDLLTTTDQSVS